MIDRLRSAPLGIHALLLGLVLVALFPLSGMRAAFTADEGAAILQARQLERGLGWIQRSPLPSVDTNVEAGLVPLADVGSKGRAPYAKHPLLPVVLAGGEQALGSFGLVLPAMLGTALASLFAGLCVGAVGGGAGQQRLVLWLVGLGSPLLFASFLATGTALAAAGATGAAAAALVAVGGRGSGSPRAARLRRWAPLGVAAGCAVAVALRTEGLLFGAALAAGAGAEALVALRRGIRSAVGPGMASVAAAVGALGARLVEERVIQSLVGTTTSVAGAVDHPHGNFVAAKLSGLGHTWFEPASPGSSLANVVVAATVLIPLGVLLARRRVRADLVPVVCLAVVMLYGLRAASAPRGGTIPGLLVATPVLLAGLCWLSRSWLTGPSRAAVVAVVLFAAAVAGTQYSSGGGADWGGRFFAIGVPLALALAVVGGAKGLASMEAEPRRLAGTALALCTVLVSVTAIQGLSHSHRVGERFAAGIGRAAARTDPGLRLAGAPIALTDQRSVPQIVFETVDQVRWLAPERQDMRRFADALANQGVKSFVLVSLDVDASAATLGPEWRLVDDATPIGRSSPIHVIVAERTAPA